MKPPKLERKPAHVPRSDLTRPEGWYTQPVYRASAMHPIGWPPRFVPQFRQTNEVAASIAARDARMGYVARTGNTGTIGGLGGSISVTGEAARKKVSIHAAR